MAGMEVYKKCLAFKNKTGRWPRGEIILDGTRISKKKITKKFEQGLISKNLYEELIEEISLFNRWETCPERNTLMKYAGVSIAQIPKKYQKMIDTLRDLGLGNVNGKIDIVERFESFYRKYGRVPKWLPPKRENLSEKEVLERRLYERWVTSDENELTKKYIDTPLEEIPELYQETIRRLRAIGVGANGRKLSAMEEYMAFVREFAREPIHYVNPVGNQKKEHAIKQRWRVCKAKFTFEKYKGVLLQEIPEGDRKIVSDLRQMWLEIDGAHVMEEYFSFIDSHKREPVSYNQGQSTFGKKLSEEEQKEADLAARWSRCFEKQVMDRFSKYKIIPNEYRDIISILRDHGLAYPESFNTRMFIEYVHENGLVPRQVICRDGKRVPREMHTKKEQYEALVRNRFDISEDKKIYEAYKAGTIDNKTAIIYEQMLHDLDSIYEIDARNRAELSKQRKEMAKLAAKANNAPKSTKKQQDDSIEEARLVAKPDDCGKMKTQKTKKLKQAELDEKKATIKLAQMFINFVKENGRFPRNTIKRQGVDIKKDDLTNEERTEQLLRRAWDRSNFMKIVDTYAGTPIEELPIEYQNLIKEFRAQGFGLTSDEYYKYRMNHTPDQVLRFVKNTRDMAQSKKMRAQKLEQIVLAELRELGKVQDDE